MITEGFLKYFPGNSIFISKTDGQGLDPKLKTPPPIHYHSTFDKCKITLHKQEKVLWGTFFTVNELDKSLDPGKQRTSKMVIRVRAVWVEDDVRRKSPRTDFPITPNIIVNSSPGKYHYYWLTSTNRFNEWKGVMATMVDEYGCDINAKDLCRILRVPGFNHNKAKPFKVTFKVLKEEPYPWSDVVRNFPVGDHSEKSSKTNQKESDHVNDIITGANFHGSFMSIAASMANRLKTLDKQFIVDHLHLLGTAALSKNKLSSERRIILEELLADGTNISECVDWAIDETKKEQVDEGNISIPDVPKEQKKRYELDWPPGLMGDLCNDIYEMAPHPNKEVAIAASFGIVSGIIGRKYNAIGMGLNLYITLLADAGIGKANLKNSVNKVFINSKDNLKRAIYKGPSRFTGPKAIFDMLANGMSRICVLEEAGLLGQSTAGDQAGLLRVLLDLYTSSGETDHAGGEAYSDNKNSSPLLCAPSLSIIFVSTPKSYLENLKSKNSEVSGETARLFSIRVDRDKEYLNRNRKTIFSPDVQIRLNHLMKFCMDRQLEKGNGEVKHIQIKDSIIDRSDYYTDLENKYKRDGDNLRRTVTSRSFAKSIKLSSDISVFNGPDDHVHDDAWSWSEATVQGELDNISSTFTVDTADDIMKMARNIIGVTIIKVLHNKFKSRKQQIDKRMRDRGVVPRTVLSQILKNNSDLNNMNDPLDRAKPKKGIDKTLEYMVDSGLLIKMKHDDLIVLGSRVKEAYKITYEFKCMYDDV